MSLAAAWRRRHEAYDPYAEDVRARGLDQRVKRESLRKRGDRRNDGPPLRFVLPPSLAPRDAYHDAPDPAYVIAGLTKETPEDKRIGTAQEMIPCEVCGAPTPYVRRGSRVCGKCTAGGQP